MHRRKKTRKLLAGSFALIAVGVGLLAVIVQSVRFVPDFYRQAIAVPAQNRRAESQAFLRQVAEISNSTRREGGWRIELTEEQINAWLASDLPNKHPELMSPDVSEPRIQITDDRLIVAYRQKMALGSMVVALTLRLELPEENMLQLHLESAKTGKLPLPLKGMLDSVSEWAREVGLDLDWHRQGSSPVAVVNLNSLEITSDHQVTLRQLELADARLILTGFTRPLNNGAAGARHLDVKEAESSVPRNITDQVETER